MTLPAAAPALGGQLIPIDPRKCWADSGFVRGRQCSRMGTERIGMCEEHTEELLDS